MWTGSASSARGATVLGRRRAVTAAVVALHDPTYGWARRAQVAVDLLRRTDDRARPRDETVVRRLLDRVQRTLGAEHAPLRIALLELLPPVPGTVDTTPIVDADPWARAVAPRLRSVAHTPADADAISGLLRHLAAARGSRPTRSWSRTAAALLEGRAAVAALRILLDAMLVPPPVSAVLPDLRLLHDPRLSGANAEVGRAAVWAAIDAPGDWVVPVLQGLAEHGVDTMGVALPERVVNAAILALGRIAAPDAVSALQRFLTQTQHSGYRSRASAALDEAAAVRGLTRGSLVEQSVDRAGLDDDGTATWTCGSVEARVSLTDDLRVRLAWQRGPRSTSPPAGASAADVAALKDRAAALRGAVTAERRRLEDLLATDRAWPLAEWRRLYLDHPITGRISRRLLWRISTGERGAATGLPLERGRLTTLDGAVPMPDDGTVTLWHVASSSPDEVAAWRDRVVDLGVTQPFAQVFREVYVLTPAEERTRTYSNRFAAHVLRYPQLYALLKARRWRTGHLGAEQGGHEAVARRELPDVGLVAHFRHVADLTPLVTGGVEVELAVSDRVLFTRGGDRSGQPVALTDVPALTFSEVMRDIDLFTSVTSIAMDPTWADRPDDPWFPYWETFPSRELAESTAARHEALSRLLPKLAFADRVELHDRYVRVRGQRHTYQVHTASAHIFVEPDEHYLCIVHGTRGPRVALPFDGDEILSLVLSKIALLVRDHEITDPDILGQLQGRRFVPLPPAPSDCPDCGHDWREHPGALADVEVCSECAYEQEHDGRQVDVCRRTAPGQIAHA